jgi:hypothetical protein
MLHQVSGDEAGSAHNSLHERIADYGKLNRSSAFIVVIFPLG